MSLDPIAIQTLWANCCRHVQSHAAAMQSLCGVEAAEMITKLTTSFGGQPAPRDSEQLAFRMRQQLALSSMIGTVSHADTMARLCPLGEGKILEAARATLLIRPIPLTDEELLQIPQRQVALSAEIARICAEHR